MVELATLLAQGEVVTFVTVVLLSLLLTWIALKLIHPILAVVVFFVVLGTLYYIVQWQGGGGLGNLLTVVYQLVSFLLIVVGSHVAGLLRRGK